MSIFAIKMKLIFGRMFGSGWCRGLWNTPRRDPKEFRIIRVLIIVPLNVGLPVDRHLRAGRQRTTR